MKKRGKKDKVEANADAPLQTNAFAGLASLSGALPSKPDQVPASAPAPAADEQPTPAQRFPNKLVVRMEKKGRRGKTVTRISGVPKNTLDALSKEMKKGLGCGATLEGPDLILLGDLVERAASWLEKAGASKVVRGN